MLQVKENFQRFISCKSTIDDIHVRLRKAEGDYGEGASGASTADMVAAVTDVRSLTHMLIMPPTTYTLCQSHSVTCIGACNMALQSHVWSVQLWLHMLLC